MQTHLMHQLQVGPQLLALFLLLLEGLFLLKKDASASRNPPFLLWADICFLIMFISTSVLSALLILFIFVFVNNGKNSLELIIFSLIVIGDLFLYALAKFAFCPSVKLTKYDWYDILYKIW